MNTDQTADKEKTELPASEENKKKGLWIKRKQRIKEEGGWVEIERLWKDHPSIILTGLYIYLGFIGVTYEYTFYHQFGINIIEYVEFSDFAVSAFKQIKIPFFAMLICILIVKIYKSKDKVNKSKDKLDKWSDKVDKWSDKVNKWSDKVNKWSDKVDKSIDTIKNRINTRIDNKLNEFYNKIKVKQNKIKEMKLQIENRLDELKKLSNKNKLKLYRKIKSFKIFMSSINENHKFIKSKITIINEIKNKNKESYNSNLSFNDNVHVNHEIIKSLHYMLYTIIFHSKNIFYNFMIVFYIGINTIENIFYCINMFLYIIVFQVNYIICSIRILFIKCIVYLIKCIVYLIKRIVYTIIKWIVYLIMRIVYLTITMIYITITMIYITIRMIYLTIRMIYLTIKVMGYIVDKIKKSTIFMFIIILFIGFSFSRAIAYKDFDQLEDILMNTNKDNCPDFILYRCFGEGDFKSISNVEKMKNPIHVGSTSKFMFFIDRNSNNNKSITDESNDLLIQIRDYLYDLLMIIFNIFDNRDNDNRDKEKLIIVPIQGSPEINIMSGGVVTDTKAIVTELQKLPNKKDINSITEIIVTELQKLPDKEDINSVTEAIVAEFQKLPNKEGIDSVTQVIVAELQKLPNKEDVASVTKAIVTELQKSSNKEDVASVTKDIITELQKLPDKEYVHSVTEMIIAELQKLPDKEYVDSVTEAIVTELQELPDKEDINSVTEMIVAEFQKLRSTDAYCLDQVLLDEVFFDIGSSMISSKGRQKISDIADKYNDSAIIIEGSADRRGLTTHNLDLSEMRAENVACFLVNKEEDIKINKNNIRITTRGECINNDSKIKNSECERVVKIFSCPNKNNASSGSKTSQPQKSETAHFLDCSKHLRIKLPDSDSTKVEDKTSAAAS